jgi:hypothetical protein
MAAEAQDFRMRSGDTKDLVISITDNADAAVDITGATIVWKAFNNAGTVVVEKATDSANGVEITDGSGGICKVHLLPADTASLAGVYNHEAEMTDVIGNVTTTTVGKMNVKLDLIA